MTNPPPAGVSAAGGDGRVLRRCDGRYMLMMHPFFFSFLHSFISSLHSFKTSPVGECLRPPHWLTLFDSGDCRVFLLIIDSLLLI